MFEVVRDSKFSRVTSLFITMYYLSKTTYIGKTTYTSLLMEWWSAQICHWSVIKDQLTTHWLTLNYFKIHLPKWSHEDDTTQECYEYHHWPNQQRKLQKDYWEVSLNKKNAIEENPYKIVQENGSFNMEDMIYGIPFMTIKIKGDPYHYSQNPNPRGIKTNKNNQYQSSKIPKGIILQDYCQFQKEWSQRQRPKW